MGNNSNSIDSSDIMLLENEEYSDNVGNRNKWAIKWQYWDYMIITDIWTDLDIDVIRVT